MEQLMQSPWFNWVLLPVLIFISRIMDVSLGTIRIMFVSRGNKLIAPILGFFEVFIWLLAIQQIMQHLTNPLCYFAYAGGFAFGNYVGILLEEKTAMGKQIIRIITTKDADFLVNTLRARGFGATNIPAQGARGNVNVIYSIVDRYDMPKVSKLIHRFNPHAFYTVEDVRSVGQGIFPRQEPFAHRFIGRKPRWYRRYKLLRRYRRIRKGK